MNSEMKAKLEQYMQADGTYNIAAIREEYPGDLRAAFNAMWSDDGESANDDPNASLKYMSEEWRAAVEYNEAVEKEQQAAQDANPEFAAEAVMNWLMTDADFRNREVKKQVQTITSESAKLALVKMLLAKIDNFEADYAAIDKTLPYDEQCKVGARYNRALTALEMMNLAQSHTNGGYQDGYSDITKAQAFVAGFETQAAESPLFNTDAPEEILTR